MTLPTFAEPIAKARAEGKRPSELIVVQDGNLGLRDLVKTPVVLIDAARHPADYDWRFLADLDVEVATLGDSSRLITLVRVIAKAGPRYLRTFRPDTGVMVRVIFAGKLCIKPENDWVCQQEELCI